MYTFFNSRNYNVNKKNIVRSNMKEKVLIVSEFCASSGGSRNGFGGSSFCMLAAQKDYFVDYLYFSERDYDAEKELKPLCNNIYHIDIGKDLHPSPIMSLIKGVPKISVIIDSNKFKEYISNLQNYNIVICMGLSALFAIDYIRGTKRNIAFLIDCLPMYYERRIKMASSIKKLYLAFQRKSIIKMEKKYLSKYDKYVFVSDVDRNYESQLHKGSDKKMFFVNNGVFLDEVEKAKPIENMGKAIVFSGIMSYKPNEDAAFFLAKKVLPLILEENPDVKLYLVGKNPSDELKKLSNSKIIVTGLVESVFAYIKGGTVFASALMYGSGMKNKVLEAMACKTALVASPVSVEGINELINGENITIVDGAENIWAKEINRLIMDENLRNLYTDKCYQIIKSNYSWDGAFNKIVE